jgi:hypothetical protein
VSKYNSNDDSSDLEESSLDTIDSGPFLINTNKKGSIRWRTPFVLFFVFIGLGVFIYGAVIQEVFSMLGGFGTMCFPLIFLFVIQSIQENNIGARLKKSKTLNYYEGYIISSRVLSGYTYPNNRTVYKYEYHLYVCQYPSVRTKSICKVKYDDNTTVQIRIDHKKPEYCLIVGASNTFDEKDYYEASHLEDL